MRIQIFLMCITNDAVSYLSIATTTLLQVRVMQRTTVTDVGEPSDVPGVTGGPPRPVGVGGKTGPEMAEEARVSDCGGSPLSFRQNVTMLPGSYSRGGGRPFSDVEWREGMNEAIGGMKDGDVS